MEFQIIYEDRQLIVCQKPAGIPVQSARAGTKDMVSMLKNYRKEHEQMSGGTLYRGGSPSGSASAGTAGVCQDKAGGSKSVLPGGGWKDEKSFIRLLCVQRLLSGREFWRTIC